MAKKKKKKTENKNKSSNKTTKKANKKSNKKSPDYLKLIKETNYLKYMIILLLAVALVVGVFAFFLQDMGISSDKDVAARVNGEEITMDEVSEVQLSLEQQGQSISKSDALEELIIQKLVLQEARQNGYTLTDEEAEDFIESELAQQGLNIDDYKEQLASEGISYDSQLRNIKDDWAIQNYLTAELEDKDFNISDEEIEEYYEMYSAQVPEGEEAESYDELEPQIIEILEQQKQQEVVNSLIQELRMDADIEYLQTLDSDSTNEVETVPLEIE